MTLITLPFSVTSPVYLVSDCRRTNRAPSSYDTKSTVSAAPQVKKGVPSQAARVLAKLHGIRDESVVRARLATIQYAVASEIEEQALLQPITYRELFTDPVERRRTWTTIGLWLAYQAGG